MQRALASVVVLLLVAAVALAKDQVDRQRRRDELAGLRLRATVAGIELRQTTVRARLLLLPNSPQPLDLQTVSLDAGWRVGPSTTPLPNRLDARSARSFVVEREIDCTPGALRLPSRVTLRVAGDGGQTQVLTADLEAPDDHGPSALELACGTLPPEGAVALLESSIVGAPRLTTVTLRLVDRSPRDAQVLAVTYSGFSLHATPALPLLLPGRRPVRHGPARSLERLLVLTVRVTDCDEAGPALAAARRVSPPDLLALDVATRALMTRRVSTRVHVDVAGLLAYLDQERATACA